MTDSLFSQPVFSPQNEPFLMTEEDSQKTYKLKVVPPKYYTFATFIEEAPYAKSARELRDVLEFIGFKMDVRDFRLARGRHKVGMVDLEVNPRRVRAVIKAVRRSWVNQPPKKSEVRIIGIDLALRDTEVTTVQSVDGFYTHTIKEK